LIESGRRCQRILIESAQREIPMLQLLRSMVAPTLLAGLVLSTGCTWAKGGGQEEVPAMHRNFSRMVDIQTGVVQGDLERATRAAAWLMDPENRSSVPTSAQAYQEEMLRLASVIADAPDLPAVSAQAGRLAAACGSCHEALDGGPRFVVGSDAPRGQSQEAHMVRHIWAADRMWEGLVGPSEEAWLAGAKALSETGPSLAETFRASLPEGVLAGFLAEVNALANQAMTSSGSDERPDTYGRILDTCHRCHAAIGVTPR